VNIHRFDRIDLIHFRRLRLLAVVLVACMAQAVFAQPAGKTMRIIVPYAAGGVTDAVARTMAARLSRDCPIRLAGP
jgi:tripartite-type tricarboxylate transporter receptor subunit TctC